MSVYNGRRAPNVSQYISNLNTIPSAHELEAQQAENEFNVAAELALFTNDNGWEFDVGDLDIPPSIDYEPIQGEKAHRQNASPFKDAGQGLDLLHDPDFPFADFQFQPLASDPSAPIQQPIQPYPIQPLLPLTTAPTPMTLTSPPHAGDKRKFDALSASSPATSHSLEEQSRLAAEEDKRRRNTAASARFRVKKKQREQALEKSAKEMSDKVTALEARIGQLEMENKWLKNLLTEKTSGKEEVMELYTRHVREKSTEEKDRSKGEGKDGVGTGNGEDQENEAEA